MSLVSKPIYSGGSFPNVRTVMLHCTACDWSATTEEHSQTETSRLAIEHHCTTGHSIESAERADSHRNRRLSLCRSTEKFEQRTNTSP
jgi:hypothetical protein